MAKSSIKICPNEKAEASQGCKKVDLSGPIELVGKKFHFIGAGGIGMSGLAKLLLKNNAVITGSDQTASHIIQQLCQLGANIKIGHVQESLDEAAKPVGKGQIALMKWLQTHPGDQQLGDIPHRDTGVFFKQGIGVIVRKWKANYRLFPIPR